LGIPELDAKVHIEGIKKGSILITITTESDRIPDMKEIFMKNNVVSLDTQLSRWD
jgi:hypothetical protein